MSYVTICFYCQKTVKLRESIMVKQAIRTHEVLHRYHPECYAKLTEPIAQQRLAYDRTLEQMKHGIQIQAHS